MPSYTKDDLIEFLDFAGRKGLMKKGTVSSYKAACNAVFSIFDEDPTQDISTMKLEDVFYRYENLMGLKFKPDTLRIYKQRVTDTVREYTAYKEKPDSWKPSHQHRALRTNGNSQHGNGGSIAKTRTKILGQKGINVPHDSDDPACLIEYRFPLRKDAIVEITGIPFDVKRAEMARLTAFISNLVAEGDQQTPEQPMLPFPPRNTK